MTGVRGVPPGGGPVRLCGALPRRQDRPNRIAAEPWHFRYVGVPHALLMEQRGLCLEEYLDLLAEQPLTCRLENGRLARVARFAAGQTLPPAQGLRQVSADNAGGVIVTDWEAAV